MANINGPFGLRPVSVGLNTPTTNVFIYEYSIVSGYSTALYPGDPVVSSGTADSEGRPGIAVAAAGNTMLGVFAGVTYVPTGGGTPISSPGYWPASTSATNIVAYVYDDPNYIFEAQMSLALAATDISNTADLVAGTGSAFRKESGWAVDSANIGQGGVRIMGLAPKLGNNSGGFGNYNIVYVKINEHEFGGTAMAKGI